MKYQNQILQGDSLEVLKTFDDEIVDCVVTSPPYWGLRDYGVSGQIGLEPTLEDFLVKMLAITKELKRVLKKTGTMWWNHGDSYGTGSGAGIRTGKQATNVGSTNFYEDTGKLPIKGYEKSLLLQAHRLAIRMVDEQGWILRNQIIWHKPNVMPSSVTDRFTNDYEPVFFFTKNKNYWFEPQFEPQTDWGERDRTKGKYKDAGLANGLSGIINSLGRNKRTVWKISTKPYSEAHFATFPSELIETPIKSGCPAQICKNCGKARELIIEASGGTIGKSWHDHSNDGKAGMMQYGENSLGSGDDYQRIVKGYTDCGCNAGWDKGIVLDPFFGSGTTGRVAMDLGRDYVGIELNPDYIKLAEKRLAQKVLNF